MAFIGGIPSGGQSADLARTTDSAPPEYGELLAKYVTPRGVRYEAWHQNQKDMTAIGKVTNFFARTLPPTDRNASLAWHLNAYNSWILNNILKKYPTNGPLDGEILFFHGKRIVISGKKTSFDQLEQKEIRPVFKEPRVHFALNCASESCPPLMNRPFTAKALDADLDRLARAFINDNPHGVVPQPDGKTLKLSKIFEWYEEDFGGKAKEIEFINKYRRSPVSGTIEFLEYSWKLNRAS